MKSKPWIAIDVFTNDVIGNYSTEIEAVLANKNRPVTVQYAPRAREVK